MINYKIAALIALAIFAAWSLESQGSDPAGGWTRCKHINTGQEIIVDGPRCPSGWMKVY